MCGFIMMWCDIDVIHCHITVWSCVGTSINCLFTIWWCVQDNLMYNVWIYNDLMWYWCDTLYSLQYFVHDLNLTQHSCAWLFGHWSSMRKAQDGMTGGWVSVLKKLPGRLSGMCCPTGDTHTRTQQSPTDYIKFDDIGLMCLGDFDVISHPKCPEHNGWQL